MGAVSKPDHTNAAPVIEGSWRRLRSGSWGCAVEGTDDLTGREVEIRRRNGSIARLKLVKRVAPARNGLPALYAVAARKP